MSHKLLQRFQIESKLGLLGTAHRAVATAERLRDAQRVHAFQRLRIGFAYCSTSIFFHCLTPFRMTSSDFSRADLNNGQRNGSERTLQLNFPHGDSISISRLRSLGAA